jgi:hypothetical protein
MIVFTPIFSLLAYPIGRKGGAMTDQNELELAARAFMDVLEERFGPKKIGFAVLVFDFGGGGNMAWISNAKRADMIKALTEFVENEGGIIVGRGSA